MGLRCEGSGRRTAEMGSGVGVGLERKRSKDRRGFIGDRFSESPSFLKNGEFFAFAGISAECTGEIVGGVTGGVRVMVIVGSDGGGESG